MAELTFNELPKAITQLLDKLENIERLLLAQREAPTPEADQLLTIQEASKMLSLTVPTLYGLVHDAKIPVSKQGKRLYFSKQEVTAWVKAGRKKTAIELSLEAEKYIRKKSR